MTELQQALELCLLEHVIGTRHVDHEHGHRYADCFIARFSLRSFVIACRDCLGDPLVG
ncbi:MAG: hypothetical protein KJP08_00755 [Gammaproteobacteria bacterium]|nr:hypothetical protein [Gammaproteobacteria bacterium]MBT8093311.1 hypothetical protein [Gammaproteobacteria bacterium]